MTIKVVHRKLGQWSLTLRADSPPGIASTLDLLGHIAVIPGHVNVVERGDECLSLARYVGVLRQVDADAKLALSGSGLAFWLGDEDGGGSVIEAPGVALTGATFAAAVAAVLPASGRTGAAGTIHTGVAGTITTTRVWETRRTALDWLCDTMGGEWRIGTTGLVDAGPASALFRTTPECIVARRDLAGVDMGRRALAGDVSSSLDARTYTSRVVVVAEGMATGSADAPTIPFKDLHGADVALTRLIDERDGTEGGNAAARASAALQLFSATRRSMRLSVSDFDVAGDITPGDVIWCYDPQAGILDPANEIPFRGRLIHPAAVRALALTWPVTRDYTVGFRRADGSWVDLSPWVEWEAEGSGEVEVADSLSTPLTSGIGSIGTTVPGGGGGAGDAAIPGVPVFGAFGSTAYQPGDGLARAAVKVTWTEPLNTDSSTIVDGDRYEVRYRPTGTTDWQVAATSWDQASLTVTGLPPSTGHDWQIRAVDYASPTNYGAWSATTTFTTAQDTTAPATPAPPSVAASLIAVQVTHTLGVAAGGTFNLPLDLDHLEVHLGASGGFTPDASTLAGKLQATGAMVTGGIAAVGTFPTASTSAVHVKVIAVDKTGNRSPASSAASATALLVDTAHISDLTASKITSGTISSTLLLAGTIQTATGLTGGKLDSAGLRAYSAAGVLTTEIDFATGAATLTGKVQTGTSGSRVVIDPASTDIQLYPTSGSSVAKITGVGVDQSGAGPASTLAWMDARSAPGASGSYSNLLLASYPSGTFRSQVLVAARQSDDQTSAWLNLQDGASDATKGAVLGMANETGVTQSLVSAFAAGITLNHLASGSYVRAQAADATLACGGSSVVASATAAYAYATGSGNASVQNGDGSYWSANADGAYGHADGQVLLSTGSALLWLQPSGECRFASTDQLSLYGADIRIGQPSGETVRSDAIYNNTATFDPNVGIATAPIGRFYRLTSSGRYKVEITAADLPLAALADLAPVTYYDRGQAEAQDGSTEGLSQQLGLIAEQVHAIPGLGHLLVELDQDGRPESVNYARVGVALIPWLHDLTARIVALESEDT